MKWPQLSIDLARTREIIQRNGVALKTGYNEIERLKTQLDRHELRLEDSDPESLLEILTPAASQRKKPWHEGVPVYSLMEAIGEVYEDDIVDDVFWWLIIYGVIAFNDIDLWSDSGNNWDWSDSADYTGFTERGAYLLNDLHAMRRPD